MRTKHLQPNCDRQSTRKSFSFVMLFTCLLIIPGFIQAQQKKSENENLPRTSAEWESQEAVWTIWPTDSASQSVIVKGIKALASDVIVNVVVQTDSIRNYALLDLKKENIDFSKVKIVIDANAKGFIRDHGPWFLFDSKNTPSRTGFKWNNFGVPVNYTRGITKKDSISMGKFAAEVTSKMKLNAIHSDLVIENGMLEINSKGVALGFMETVLQRNPGFDLPAITAELKRVLGLKKIIWLGSSPTMEKLYAGPKAANIIGNGANGHIDQYVRFANDSTILISQLDVIERKYDPVSSADYLILQENLKYLKNATDDKDSLFHIYEIPVPAMRFHMVEETIPDVSVDTIIYKGLENGAAIYNAPIVSYLNFFVSNNTVLLPEYYNEKLTDSEKMKDEKVAALFRDLFPSRKIVRINPIALNLKGAGLHRCFLEQPAGIQFQLNPNK